MPSSTKLNKFEFKLKASSGKARAGVMKTPHGDVKTPVFMTVGTKASVKSLDGEDLDEVGAPIILANNYHLYLRPGLKVIKKVGGVHKLMNWSKPMLTDSGGFQVFSLDKTQGGPGVKIDSKGVEFRSHLDGSLHKFTPQVAVESQRVIGADIIMVLDQCAEDKASKSTHKLAIKRTLDWSKQALEFWQDHKKISAYGNYQALFAIVQGGRHLDLRKSAAEDLIQLPFDGYAVGGETVGYNMKESRKIMTFMSDVLPKNKPRYAMGLGRDPQDIIDAVMAGFDMFDCVGPTRLARNGALFHGELVVKNGKPKFDSKFDKARLRIGSKKYATDLSPIQKNCGCPTCTAGYSRAYLYHLYKQKELSYYRFATRHNLWVLNNLIKQLRQLILDSKIKE